MIFLNQQGEIPTYAIIIIIIVLVGWICLLHWIVN
jgi:hypothetical protein